MLAHIDPGNLERVSRNIARIDARLRKRLRGQHREASGTRAQVERAAHRPVQPGAQALAQQLGDERARHDDAPVDVEAPAVQPCFVQEVGERNALANSPVEERFPLAGGFDAREKPGRLSPGLVRAVAVAEPGPAKAPLDLAQGQGRRARRTSR